MMNDLKHFKAGISNVVLAVRHIITDEAGIKPPVSYFVKLIASLKYEDGSYYTYYDEIKKAVKSFLIYWRETMDETVKRVDYLYHHHVDKELLMSHTENTISLWEEYQKKFHKDFFPIESPQQQKIYDDLEMKFMDHMKALHDLRTQVEALDHHDKVVAFAHEQYAKSVEVKKEVFNYTHTYLSMLLADHLPEIRGSLKEILVRLRHNLTELEDERDTRLNDLLVQLYERRKELHLLKSRHGTYTKIVETSNSIDKIQELVQNCGNHETIWNVRQNVALYEKRYAEFERIASTLTKVKEELEETYREERICNSMLTNKQPSPKGVCCWPEKAKNFLERKNYLKDLLVHNAKALSTFFAVRSATDEILSYEGENARYSVDFYGHVIHHFNHGLKRYHLDETGKCRMTDDNDVDYIDDVGHYIWKNKQKVYQAGNCTSMYTVGKNTLLEKVEIDSEYSESTKRDTTQSAPIDEMLSKTQTVDIKSTLNSEVVTYLWDALGAILTDALYEVGQLKPTNPIHHLAHVLLKHKYGKTPAELNQIKIESEEYRAKILQQRKQALIEKDKAWKAKQVKRRRPEELDDSFNRGVYDIHVATKEFINSLNYCN